jgi:hypothetical protein
VKQRSNPAGRFSLTKQFIGRSGLFQYVRNGFLSSPRGVFGLQPAIPLLSLANFASRQISSPSCAWTRRRQLQVAERQGCWPAAQHFSSCSRAQKSAKVRPRARQPPWMICPALVDILHPSMTRRSRPLPIENRDPSSPTPRSGYAQVRACGCPGVSVSRI